jgi:bifunctional DNase/RNase
MDRIKLNVLGLSASPASNNAYALIMKEEDGNRRLPIIIGAFEAQAIALEMENVIPPRPMTHDLLKNVIEAFGSILSEVYINELRDGTFYAKLIFEDYDLDLDARPSDAIALAIRLNSPIFIDTDIFEQTAVLPQGEEEPYFDDEQDDFAVVKSDKNKDSKTTKPKTKLEQLQVLLDTAINSEDYEKAAKLRDEINKILTSS